MDADEMAAQWLLTWGNPPRVEHARSLAILLRRYAASRLREAAGKLRERHAPASDIDAYFADWLTERAAAEERG
jgi:hypothetical protein